MPADARDAARRIVDDVFGRGGSDDAPIAAAPATDDDALPVAPAAAVDDDALPVAPAAGVDDVALPVAPAAAGDDVALPVAPTAADDAVRRRARELVAEVFDPPPPPPVVPPPPSAAELAGRRIVAEADAAQRARAEEQAAARAAAVRAERAAADAAHRERALQARREWAARARAEQDAAEERERALALAQQERERSERQRQAADAARAEEAALQADHPDPGREHVSVPVAGDEALFPAEDDSEPTAEGQGGLFERELQDLPPSLTEDVDGPPAPPLDGSPLRLAEVPPASQLAAQLVSEVLEDRSAAARDEPADEEPPDPDEPDRARPRRAARWLAVTVVGAVILALLFPLAVRAVLQLVTLS